MKLLPAIGAFQLTLPAPLAAARRGKIGNTIPYDPAAPVRDAIKNECGLDSLLSQALVEFGHGDIQTTGDDLKKAKGKVFIAKIAGVWATGGPWGGASIRVEGQLLDNGKVIGTVASRRNTSRGGYGACGKISVSARKVAEDIAGWMKSPSMD